jgi:DNA-binding response OmpR family regulator
MAFDEPSRLKRTQPTVSPAGSRRLAIVRYLVPRPDLETRTTSRAFRLTAGEDPAPSQQTDTRRVLLVTTENSLAQLFLMKLRSEGYEIEVEPNGERAKARAAVLRPHAVIIDATVQDVEFFDLCRDLTACSPTALVLQTTLGGIQKGAIESTDVQDDALGRLALVENFTSLLDVALGRRRASLARPSRIQFGETLVDLASGRVERNGEEIQFTQKETQLLVFLLAHPTVPFSRDDLLQRVWGYQEAPLSRTVDTHIARLRQKVEVDPRNPRFIQTVYGTGYTFQP